MANAIYYSNSFDLEQRMQSEDRCHRIGQKKPVTVYKLIAKDSVDEDIYRMQEKKVRWKVDMRIPFQNLMFQEEESSRFSAAVVFAFF